MTLRARGVSVHVITDASAAEQYRKGQLFDSSVYIADLRSGGNPDMQVINSYRITNENLRREICQYLILYCAANQGNGEYAWKRTVDSMETEWKAHNDLYMLYNNDRCRHVDFDNADEGVSYWEFVWRAICSIF